MWIQRLDKCVTFARLTFLQPGECSITRGMPSFFKSRFAFPNILHFLWKPTQRIDWISLQNQNPRSPHIHWALQWRDLWSDSITLSISSSILRVSFKISFSLPSAVNESPLSRHLSPVTDCIHGDKCCGRQCIGSWYTLTLSYSSLIYPQQSLSLSSSKRNIVTYFIR